MGKDMKTSSTQPEKACRRARKLGKGVGFVAGIDFWPTVANFIFCYFPEPVRLEAALRERGILVRPKKDGRRSWFHGVLRLFGGKTWRKSRISGRFQDHKGVLGLRISFGTLEQLLGRV